jgi:HTH-type transcriptional regulator/antitoxin HigA
MSKELTKVIQCWDKISPVVTYPKTKKAFEKLQHYLDELLTVVGDNEKHHLMSLVDHISYLITIYEEKHYAMPAKKGVKALQYLMDEHGLKQSDLLEIGS